MRISAINGCENRSKTQPHAPSFKAIVGEREFIKLVETTSTNIPARSTNALVDIVKDSVSYFSNKGFKDIVVNFRLEKPAKAGETSRVLCTAQDFNVTPAQTHTKDLTSDLLELSSENSKKTVTGIKNDLKSWFKKFAGGREIDETPKPATSTYDSSPDIDMDEIWNKYSGYGPWDSPYT